MTLPKCLRILSRETTPEDIGDPVGNEVASEAHVVGSDVFDTALACRKDL